MFNAILRFKQNNGQIATILTFVIAIIFLFMVVTMNIAKKSQLHHKIDRAAQGTALILASYAASLSYEWGHKIWEEDGSDRNDIDRWKRRSKDEFNREKLYAWIVAAAAIGITILTMGATIAEGVAATGAAAAGGAGLGVVAGGTALSALSLSSTAGFFAMAAAAGLGIGAGMLAERNADLIYSQYADWLKGLAPTEQFSEQILMTALGQIVNDPRKVRDVEDFNEDGRTDDEIPFFFDWMRKRANQIKNQIKVARAELIRKVKVLVSDLENSREKFVVFRKKIILRQWPYGRLARFLEKVKQYTDISVDFYNYSDVDKLDQIKLIDEEIKRFLIWHWMFFIEDRLVPDDSRDFSDEYPNKEGTLYSPESSVSIWNNQIYDLQDPSADRYYERGWQPIFDEQQREVILGEEDEDEGSNMYLVLNGWELILDGWLTELKQLKARLIHRDGTPIERLCREGLRCWRGNSDRGVSSELDKFIGEIEQFKDNVILTYKIMQRFIRSLSSDRMGAINHMHAKYPSNYNDDYWEDEFGNRYRVQVDLSFPEGGWPKLKNGSTDGGFYTHVKVRNHWGKAGVRIRYFVRKADRAVNQGNVSLFWGKFNQAQAQAQAGRPQEEVVDSYYEYPWNHLFAGGLRYNND